MKHHLTRRGITIVAMASALILSTGPTPPARAEDAPPPTATKPAAAPATKPATKPATTQPAPNPLAKKLPFPGEVFLVQGHVAFLMLPKNLPKAAPSPRTPWVIYAPTLPGLPGGEDWMFKQWLDAGIAIAGIDVGESYGSPRGRALFTALYNELVDHRGMSQTPCVLGRSRGGLQILNWAADNPARVAGIAGIYPVCDLRSYPGLGGASRAYEMTDRELAAQESKQNPIERLEPLAKAGVPIYFIQGDADKLVPLEKNAGEVAKRYKTFGGTMTLNIAPGQGHNVWEGFFHCQELVDFVIARSQPKAEPPKPDMGPGNGR
ncbi:MAG: prolyl oligopeptidase family serine peptidase [Planctomycetota bacterium]|nr:prolyl oligopeptidase family serine peptidase [Planctomycetota bacterium]